MDTVEYRVWSEDVVIWQGFDGAEALRLRVEHPFRRIEFRYRIEGIDVKWRKV